jgi:hypothetical protein
MFDKYCISKAITSDADYLSHCFYMVKDPLSFRNEILYLFQRSEKNYSAILLDLSTDDFLKYILLNLSLSLIEFNTFTAFRDYYNSKYGILAANFKDVPKLDLIFEFDEIIDLLNQHEK